MKSAVNAPAELARPMIGRRFSFHTSAGNNRVEELFLHHTCISLSEVKLRKSTSKKCLLKLNIFISSKPLFEGGRGDSEDNSGVKKFRRRVYRLQIQSDISGNMDKAFNPV
jgi:hypothetical protein